MTNEQRKSVESYLDQLLLTFDMMEDMADEAERSGKADELERYCKTLDILFAKTASAIEVLDRLGYKIKHDPKNNSYSISERS